MGIFKKDDKKPEDDKSKNTKPEDTKPEAEKPEDTKPEDVKPEDVKPEGVKPLECSECGSSNVTKRTSGYIQCHDCNYLDRGDEDGLDN